MARAGPGSGTVSSGMIVPPRRMVIPPVVAGCSSVAGSGPTGTQVSWSVPRPLVMSVPSGSEGGVWLDSLVRLGPSSVRTAPVLVEDDEPGGDRVVAADRRHVRDGVHGDRAPGQLGAGHRLEDGDLVGPADGDHRLGDGHDDLEDAVHAGLDAERLRGRGTLALLDEERR